ncbi:hypothetical protein BV25DRAFT_1832143 [Artomyces pyxidatus]|uniref:Uncharacterized protein n=1 Tax=Artomyces pyxidatus TaxID=48021 RepID=A0ACB8SKU1_9AGAM|nr:hypothetical protein BV25DRAFT_1832143 [Artomyces pyxidatus]
MPTPTSALSSVRLLIPSDQATARQWEACRLVNPGAWASPRHWRPSKPCTILPAATVSLSCPSSGAVARSARAPAGGPTTLARESGPPVPEPRIGY